MTRCQRCLEWNAGDPWYCPRCGKETTATPHDGGAVGDVAAWTTEKPESRCRLVCSLGRYVWRPALRHPLRMVWRYAETPCSCGARTWRYGGAA